VRTELRLLRLVRPYWGLLAVGIAVTFFASVLDGFVLVVLIPLLKNLFGTAGELHGGSTQLEALVDRMVEPLVAGLPPVGRRAGRGASDQERTVLPLQPDHGEGAGGAGP
jgi:hypothetical protein